MINGLRVGGGADQLVLIANVAGDVTDVRAVPLPQPIEVSFDSRPRKRVVDDDFVTLAREPIGKVGADEAGAAGDQDRPAVAVHATRPLASSSERASSTRSCAVWLATHTASSASPSSKSLVARKPSRSAALLLSQKQWRISPIRALPVISGSRSSRPSARAICRATSRTDRKSVVEGKR